MDKLSMEEVDITLVDSDLIRVYLVHLMNAKRTHRTISRHVSSLKMFYKYLILYDLVAVNPMKRIKTPKYLRKLPNFFSPQEMDALCNLPDTDTFMGIRDKAILELFYSSGIRITELVTLTYRGIDFKDRLITVMGKGSKKRKVPVTEKALDWIRKYNKIRNNTTNDIFFLTKDNKPLTRFKVYLIVKKYLNTLLLNQGYSPHTIRHTFATHLLDRGANLYSIKEMLGHESIVTTQTYTHVLPQKMREEYLKGHPRADKKLDVPK